MNNLNDNQTIKYKAKEIIKNNKNIISKYDIKLCELVLIKGINNEGENYLERLYKRLL